MSGRLSRLYQGETDIDFIGRRKIWFIISGVLMLLCFVTLYAKGLNYGIEFEGGIEIVAPIADDGPLGDAGDTDVVDEVRSAIGELGADEAQIQVRTDDDGRSVIVQTKEIAEADAQAEFIDVVNETVGAEIEETDSQRIGSKWGEEITNKAIRALIIFLIVVFLFISWRFEWKMGLASLIALIHDLVITAGVYSIVGFEVTPSSVIAILTILGYSLYDTVVVFDKVEENAAVLANTGRMTYQDSANLALNQVFMRSLNTSLATILPVGALLFVGAGLLGATTLSDLALALLVGLLIGAYSSVFVATPILSVWKEREQRFKNVREKVRKDLLKSSAPGPTGPAEAAEGAAPVGSPGPSAPAAAPASVSTATRARAGSKKVKRRKRR